MNPEKRKKKERIKNQIKSNNMEKKVFLELPKGKKANNITGKMVDGKIEVSYDIVDIFKDGDFLVSKRGNIFIYNGKEIECFLGCYVGFTKNGDIYISHKQINKWTLKDGCRYATEQEKQSFLERLEKMYKKKWNAEKKFLEDIYVPKFGDIVHVDLKDTDVYAPNKFCICIYPNVDKFEESNQFFNIANLGAYGELTPTIGSHVKSISPASESEKKKLYEKLAQGGKKWNEVKKCLEDIYEPKFGDIVCIEHPDAEDYSRQYVISIFPNKEIPNKSKSGFFDIACIDMEGRLQINSEAYYNHGHIREATIAEKQELFRKLAAVRKRWNPKTKQIEDARWRAEKDCVYYTVINSGFVAKQTEKYRTVDYVNYKNNNYFRTPEAAQKVAEQIKEIFKNSKAE